MKTIRVLHIIQSLRGYGAEHLLFALLPLLRSETVAVGVLAVYTSNLTAGEIEALGCPAIDLGRRRRSDYSFPLRLVREIGQFAPDIVHTHMHVGKYWGRVAARLAGAPILVHTEHNPCDLRRSALERLLDPMLSRGTDCIITFLTEQGRMLSRIDRIPPEKVAIIPNGIEPGRTATREQRVQGRRLLGVSDEELAVLLIGRLEYQKNQSLALLALAALPEGLRARVRLFLLGSGSEERMLRDVVRQHGLRANVVFLGYRNDVSSLLPGGDLVLMTSRFEGMPLTLIEAMLAGVPILTTPWIGSRSMLGDGAFGFVAQDWHPQTLASMLERIADSAAERAEAAARARDHAVQAYDIHRMAEAYRDLYVRLSRERSVTGAPARAAAL